jgi:hypothetical protein
MRHETQRFARIRAGAFAACTLAILAGSVSLSSAARADEAQARALLKKMSDYMGAQKAISFDYDSNLQVVSNEKQKFGLASSGKVTLNRPDKVHMTRVGGFANVEMAFDGKDVTLLGKKANEYAQVESPGTVDNLIVALRNKVHRPLPAADLLFSDAYAQLMPNVVDVKDLGSGVIRGQECDHIAGRSKNADWEIWIAQGDRPYPCRLVITTTSAPESPQYTFDVRSWKTGAEVGSDSFKIDVANARKVNPDDLVDFNELPAVFAVKKTTTGETKDQSK